MIEEQGKMQQLHADLTGRILRCAIEVHRELGPGLLENAAIDQLLPIHDAQLLTYLRFSQIRVGLLINFNVRVLKDGIRRRVN